jgi:hypothetical protein
MSIPSGYITVKYNMEKGGAERGLYDGSFIHGTFSLARSAPW